jgi:hypothetical protein
MRTAKQIILEELDRSIGCARWWGKDEAYDSLTELKQRVEYRLRDLEQTQPKPRIHVSENKVYKEIPQASALTSD